MKIKYSVTAQLYTTGMCETREVPNKPVWPAKRWQNQHLVTDIQNGLHTKKFTWMISVTCSLTKHHYAIPQIRVL